MIRDADVPTRRIMTFPAVHPCDTVSPATLLASLIVISRQIVDKKSRFFSTNGHNVRKSLRFVEVLLDFLEELRDRNTDVPISAFLSLSELHLAFQKINYLLEDCTSEGAKLWMLMKSERVSNYFRVLVRSVATALDVLPINSLDVSTEVKEMVLLVRRQARNSRFDVDLGDKLALDEFDLLLKLFEKMSVPEIGKLRRVLDHLGIYTWSACNHEINFLYSELTLETSNSDQKRSVPSLTCLIGFMSYCRCVFFNVIDGQQKIKQPENPCNVEVLNYLNPDDFRCPISLEFMVDPVTVSTGHTYDRASIQKWFNSGNPTCPKTGVRLKRGDLIPNVAIQRLIRQYCSENSTVIAPESSNNQKCNLARTVIAGSAVAEGAMKMVSHFLVQELVNGTNEQKNKAAYEIQLLSKTNIFNRYCLIEAGSIPCLLILVLSADAVIQENAIAALLNLSKQSKAKAAIVENGGVLMILDVLKKGLKDEAKQHAAAVMFYLSSIKEYRKLIGEIPEAIPSLVDLIKTGNDHAKKNALVTIFGLLMHENNHWKVLAAETVPLLISFIKSGETSEDVITYCLAVLSNLADKPDGTIAILRRGGLKLVLEILNCSHSKAGKEYCVSLLLALCVNGGGIVVSVLVKDQALIGSLYALLTEGTPRASKKASSIIKILHEFDERRSSALKISSFAQERIVHVW